MIKFEEHEGKLFHMLEKPVPLKENDANVLVRFITHGIIGEYVMEHWLDCNQENIPIYVEDVDSDGDVTVWIDLRIEIRISCPFPMFEIIGILVKEGSAEWAWHMMQERYKTKHCESTSQRFYAIREGNNYCAFYDNEWKEVDINTRRIYCEFIEYAKAFPGYGWRILKEHEQPKPEPQYKVGDWVEWCGDQYMIESAPPQSGGRYDIRSPYDELGCSVCPENITRKLASSEVVIRIGCLSGTIAKSSDPNYFLMLHSRPITDCNHSIIRFSAIDTETREIVESLLKAQEEENAN